VLVLIARPLNAARAALIAGLAAGLGSLFVFPFTRRTFSLQAPPPAVALATLGTGFSWSAPAG
jgi:hypothetical protein